MPLGPYAPALPQPLALRLKLRGDRVVGVEPPLTGYCRRGAIELATNSSVEDALALVDRSCSLAGTAHRLALVAALEALAAIEPASSARITRVLCAEVERILARLWILALAARGAGVVRHERAALEQREALLEAMRSATGQRVFWAVAIPGGTRPDFTYALDALAGALAALDAQVPTWRSLVGPRGPIGQAARGAGALSAARADALALAGVAAGGSTAARDLRRDDPYSGYNDLTITWPARAHAATSDAAVRLAFVVEDMATSTSIARECLTELAGASASARAFVPDPALAGREAAATVEGPHGPVTVAVALAANGTIERLRLETRCAAVADALPELLEGCSLSQVPLLLASVDLCPECLDL